MNKFYKGIALILEGHTEKYFYFKLLYHLAEKYNGYSIYSNGLDSFVLQGPKEEERKIIKLRNVGSISQIPHCVSWLRNSCLTAYAPLIWDVFLCYDTDSYKPNITKFNEGDWKTSKEEIKKDALVKK